MELRSKMAMEITSLTKEKMKTMFAEGKRFDGRKLNEHREISVEEGISNQAEGSARVKIGKTEVLVGVKLAPGEPYPDSPEKGNISVSAEIFPMASPRVQAGPPDFNGIELPRLVDRAIRESKMIDLEGLCIKKGEKVWTVFIDLYPINDDGNLIDAANIGALAALKMAKIPELDKDGKKDKEKEAKEKLPLSKEIAPISFSFFKLGDSIIVDPTREEEEACEARITWGISKTKDKYLINSCQKKGVAYFTADEMAKMTAMLPELYDKVNEKLKKFF